MSDGAAHTEPTRSPSSTRDLSDGVAAAPPPQTPDEGPSDRTTLTAVVDAYRDSGFATDFYAEEADPTVRRNGDPTAVLRCGECASAIDPRRAAIHSMRRLEGASDPADMAAVVATTCPVCGADGTVVLAYGPMADAADADVLLAMRDVRGEADLPGDRPPTHGPEGDGDRTA